MRRAGWPRVSHTSGWGKGSFRAPYVFCVNVARYSLLPPGNYFFFWRRFENRERGLIEVGSSQRGESFCGPTHRITSGWWARRQTIESRILSHVLEATHRRGNQKLCKRIVEARSALRPVARVVDDLVERAYEFTPLLAHCRPPPIIGADIERRFRDVLTKTWIFDLSSPHWLVIFHFAYSRK
jgi:hypothetical protein